LKAQGFNGAAGSGSASFVVLVKLPPFGHPGDGGSLVIGKVVSAPGIVPAQQSRRIGFSSFPFVVFSKLVFFRKPKGNFGGLHVYLDSLNVEIDSKAWGVVLRGEKFLLLGKPETPFRSRKNRGAMLYVSDGRPQV